MGKMWQESGSPPDELWMIFGTEDERTLLAEFKHAQEDYGKAREQGRTEHFEI